MRERPPAVAGIITHRRPYVHCILRTMGGCSTGSRLRPRQPSGEESGSPRPARGRLVAVAQGRTRCGEDAGSRPGANVRVPGSPPRSRGTISWPTRAGLVITFGEGELARARGEAGVPAGAGMGFDQEQVRAALPLREVQPLELVDQPAAVRREVPAVHGGEPEDVAELHGAGGGGGSGVLGRQGGRQDASRQGHQRERTQGREVHGRTPQREGTGLPGRDRDPTDAVAR